MDYRKRLGISKGEKVEKTKPGHGPCCTCQTCGFYHADCKCYDNTLIEICEYIDQLQAKNKQLREVLGEARGVVEELATQCAPDVARGCWPVGFGYSPKDVKRIDKCIEQILKG